MNFLDLLPDDVIEIINYHLSRLDINEKRNERKKKKKLCRKRIKNWLNSIKYVKNYLIKHIINTIIS